MSTPYITQICNPLRKKQGEFVKEIIVVWTMVKSGSLPPTFQKKEKREKLRGQTQDQGFSCPYLNCFSLRVCNLWRLKSFVLGVKEALSFQKIQGI